MTEHLGHERHAAEGRGSGNSRNGSAPKRVAAEIGEVDLAVPRDRAGAFEPATVPKHRRRLEGLSGNVISLCAKGLTTGEIQDHLAGIDDTSVSRETISKITEGIVADMAAWQNRTARAGVCGALDRRDRRQGPRPPGRRPARVRGDRRGSRRRARRAGHVAGPRRRGGRQAVGGDAHRAAQPRPRRRADRVLRRAGGPSGVDPGDLARRDGADLRGAHGPQQPAVCVQEAPGRDHQGHAGDLHVGDRRGRRSPLRGVRRRLGRHLPGDDPLLAACLGRVRPVPGVPPRAAPSRLHHQRHREPQRQIPQSSAASRALTPTNRPP